jgi:hypothetical protein
MLTAASHLDDPASVGGDDLGLIGQAVHRRERVRVAHQPVDQRVDERRPHECLVVVPATTIIIIIIIIINNIIIIIIITTTVIVTIVLLLAPSSSSSSPPSSSGTKSTTPTRPHPAETRRRCAELKPSETTPFLWPCQHITNHRPQAKVVRIPR